VSNRIIRIYSVCAQVTESYFRRALELNASLSHGALAIENLGGVPHFIVVHSFPRATTAPSEVRDGVMALAKLADHIEYSLTGRDRN
jgi:hypothetical protein